MDYKEYSKDLLGRKNNLVSAYSSIKSELEYLEEQKTTCKTASLNCKSEAERSVYDERFINILADLEDCRFRRSVVERELRKIEKGMMGLSDYQKEIIEKFFIENDSTAAEELMERWFKERSSLYRDRNRALEQFTRSVYGVLQL